MGSILVSTVHELGSREKSRQSWDSNPRPLGEKLEHYLCAVHAVIVVVGNLVDAVVVVVVTVVVAAVVFLRCWSQLICNLGQG